MVSRDIRPYYRFALWILDAIADIDTFISIVGPYECAELITSSWISEQSSRDSRSDSGVTEPAYVESKEYRRRNEGVSLPESLSAVSGTPEYG